MGRRSVRGEAARRGRETVGILEEGRYQVGEVVVELDEVIDRSMDLTREYPPGAKVQKERLGPQETTIEVRNETTLTAARRLIEDGLDVAVLNFASAKSPGGGFMSGAMAQEEYLARSSGLYACLVDREMYEHHRARRDPMYTSWAIYSPLVPVIRDDSGELLEEPYLCSMITAPAVNAKAVLRKLPEKGTKIRAAMDERIRKVLGIAAEHDHDGLVLGAWGCGAFGNDTEVIAELFEVALCQRFRGAFRRVIFAITDWSDDERFIGPFERRFEPSSP